MGRDPRNTDSQENRMKRLALVGLLLAAPAAMLLAATEPTTSHPHGARAPSAGHMMHGMPEGMAGMEAAADAMHGYHGTETPMHGVGAHAMMAQCMAMMEQAAVDPDGEKR
jgi:hypothetical protein